MTDKRPMTDMSQALVDALIAAAPGHVPNTRPVHAFGLTVSGYFRGSHAATTFTTAEHFGRGWTPVTVRFSCGSGFPCPDISPQARGMAVKFHLGARTADAAGWHGERETDLIAMTVPVFVTKTAEATLKYTPATKPQPIKRPSWFRQLVALAQLSPLPLDPPGVTMSSAAGMLAMANEYAPARAGVFALGSVKPPVSYLRAAYFAVHAFDLQDAQGGHHLVRFTWEPVAGARDETRSDVPADYLATELREHLDRGPAQFILRMQIADPFDDVADPTVAWPATRRRVTMGRLFVDSVIADQDAGGERLTFNPGRLVPGIAMSTDPILHARAAAYQESARRRSAIGCPVAY